MMEIVLFTANAILVYLLADWIVRAIAKRRGGEMPNQKIVFFIVFFALILISFETLKLILGASG